MGPKEKFGLVLTFKRKELQTTMKPLSGNQPWSKSTLFKLHPKQLRPFYPLIGQSKYRNRSKRKPLLTGKLSLNSFYTVKTTSYRFFILQPVSCIFNLIRPRLYCSSIILSIERLECAIYSTFL